MFLMALALSVSDPPELPPPPQLRAEPQPMAVEVVRDPINDQVRGFAILREAGNRLVVSCSSDKDKGPSVSFHARRWLARADPFTGRRQVTHRFDDGAPERLLWDVNDRRGMIGDSRAARFLAQLMDAHRLVIRTRDLEHHRYDLSFQLTGVRPAVEQALAACGQSPETVPAEQPNRRRHRVHFRL